MRSESINKVTRYLRALSHIISGFKRPATYSYVDAPLAARAYRGILVVVALAGDLHAEFAGNLCRWERDVGITVSTSVFLRSYGNAVCKP